MKTGTENQTMDESDETLRRGYKTEEVPSNQGGVDAIPEPNLHRDRDRGAEDMDVETQKPNTDEDAAPAEDEAPDESNFLTGLKLYLLVACFVGVGFLVSLNASVVATAIPKITTDFHSIEDVGWYGSAYLFANCAVQPMAGKIYSLYPLKPTFLAFLALFELGSLLSAVSPNSAVLIVGRAVAGVGGAGIINGALNILNVSAPLRKIPMLVGFIYSVTMVGAVVGPPLGGVLTDKATWRWCFYLNLPLGAIAGLVLSLTRILDRKTAEDGRITIWKSVERLDLLGFATFASAITMCLLALEWGGNTYAWRSTTVVGLFCGALIGFGLFLASQYYKKEAAMIPLRILSNRVVYSSCLTKFFQMGGLFILAYFLPVWFQVVKGATPTLSGIYILPSVLSQIIGTLVCGWLVSKLGYYLPWAVSGSILTSIGSGLMSTFNTSTGTVSWVGYQILTGIGRGMALQQGVTAIQAAISPEHVAQGTSLTMFANYFGGALFVALGKTVFSNQLIQALREFAPGVDAKSVLDAGASGVRNVVPEGDLPGVIAAFNQALAQTFYLAAGATAMAFFTSWGLGWRSVKKQKGAKQEN